MKYGIDQFKLLDDFTLPKRFRVQPFFGNSPVPACDVEQSRMVLSGWRFVQRYVWHQGASEFAEPEIMVRPLDHPKQPRFELRRWRLSFDALRAEVHDLKTGAQRDLGRVEWVDADHKGDVLWSAGGKLFRLAGPSRQGMEIDAEPKLVADLNDMTFEPIEAPKKRTALAIVARDIAPIRFNCASNAALRLSGAFKRRAQHSRPVLSNRREEPMLGGIKVKGDDGSGVPLFRILARRWKSLAPVKRKRVQLASMSPADEQA